MTLGALCFIIIIVGLVALVCVPLDGGLQKIARVTVLVCTVLWVIFQFVGPITIGR